MGAGGGAAFGGHSYGGGRISHSVGAPAVKSAYEIQLDELYGPGWRERTLKTLEQELKDRGVTPETGDDGYHVVPTPRLVGDRVALGMICVVIAFLGICACWAWWEYLPDDGSPFYTQRTR
jgi:hypothetical protein